jgi:hypothetical protein
MDGKYCTPGTRSVTITEISVTDDRYTIYEYRNQGGKDFKHGGQ